MWTWTCHVCGQERPDERISVRTMDVSAEHGLPPGYMRQNVRYCNDRERCRDGAAFVKFGARGAPPALGEDSEGGSHD